MAGWLYKLHHDHDFFARLKRRVLWGVAGYLLLLSLWTGVLPALLTSPLQVLFFRGHEGMDTFIFGG